MGWVGMGMGDSLGDDKGSMKQPATMMTGLSGGILGSDTATQLAGMEARMTAMQKGLVTLMVVPLPAAQAAPQPGKP